MRSGIDLMPQDFYPQEAQGSFFWQGVWLFWFFFSNSIPNVFLKMFPIAPIPYALPKVVLFHLYRWANARHFTFQ